MDIAYDKLDFRIGLNPGRLLSDGIAWWDYRQAEVLRDSDPDADWFAYWSALSRRYEPMGREAIAAGHHLTGGRWLWLASLCSQYAQFIWFHDPVRREAEQRRKVELYRDAAPYLYPPARRVEIPLGETNIASYLRLPPGAEEPVPCAVLIVGLESTKEESHLFENLLLERGIATLTFDGPGQGETFFEVKLVPDFHRWTSACLDYVAEQTEIDADRLVVLGRSLGGYYALQSAAADPRLKASVCWGGTFDLSDFDIMPPHIARGFLYVSGYTDLAAGRDYIQHAIDLREIAPELQCPTLIVNGRQDAIFSDKQIAKFQANLVHAPVEYYLEGDGIHCAHNLWHIVRPRMVDWLAAQIASASPASAAQRSVG
jgi:2,6-dihydroxypseudooxynicotine hydrolase